MTLRSFDDTHRARARVVRPETYRSLFEALSTEGPLIARGAGLSYTPASFDDRATSIDLTRFDRIISFDEQTGSVDVEPGVSIGVLARFLAARSRLVFAMPGYPTITVGGCMAFDIHGKSQFHSGNFADWVESFDLHHVDHGVLHCSREHNAELFALTLGGAGLTGVILRAKLRTVRLEGTAIEVSAVPVRNLLEASEVLRQRAEDTPCLYSWHDLNLRGRSFGAGVVYIERFVADEVPQSFPRARDVLVRWPFGVWNRASTRVVTSAYGALQRRRRPSVQPLSTALFPIVGKESYYAAFGRSGFREYQTIVPFDRWPAFIDDLRRLIETCSVPITLGSLKLFRGEPRYLRFVGDGICLALDVPNTAPARSLFARIDELVIANGASVNLAKDSRLDAVTCARAFPEYERFRNDLLRFDPKRRYQSRMRTQAGL